MSVRKLPTTPLPWKIVELTDAEIFAIRAFAAGKADEHQQLLVWGSIRKIAQADLMSFWPGAEDGRRATDFHEGKRFVADQLRRVSRLQPSRVDPRGEPPAIPTETKTE